MRLHSASALASVFTAHRLRNLHQRLVESNASLAELRLDGASVKGRMEAVTVALRKAVERMDELRRENEALQEKLNHQSYSCYGYGGTARRAVVLVMALVVRRVLYLRECVDAFVDVVIAPAFSLLIPSLSKRSSTAGRRLQAILDLLVLIGVYRALSVKFDALLASLLRCI